MRSAASELRLLERLLPTENGVTVFDAETQETSYGICFFGGFPFIFDTHRKDEAYVATIELLTEIVAPVRIPAPRVRRFSSSIRLRGLLPIPYTGCFFMGNLHVYSFSGPVRGFDIAAVGSSAAQAERRLQDAIGRLWSTVPPEIVRAQQDLLQGRRKVRHAADLEVLHRRRASSRGVNA